MTLFSFQAPQVDQVQAAVASRSVAGAVEQVQPCVGRLGQRPQGVPGEGQKWWENHGKSGGNPWKPMIFGDVSVEKIILFHEFSL